MNESLFQPGGKFFLIAGPCVLEDVYLHRRIATVLCEVRDAYNLPVIFKGSFDKANRSAWQGQRGPGLSRGLELLAQVKEEFQLPVMTDVHEPWQAKRAAAVCDVLQVPAALCRQTDLLCAVANADRPVILKKGQWVGIEEMWGAVEKVRMVRSPGYPVAITERGTFFGYGDVVADMRNIPRIQIRCDVPVIFDATHTVQRPGGLSLIVTDGERHWVQSGGEPELTEPLALAAVAAGANGLYLEVHPQPVSAPSDAACMLPLERLEPLLRYVIRIRRALDHDDSRPTKEDTCGECGESVAAAKQYGCVAGWEDCPQGVPT